MAKIYIGGLPQEISEETLKSFLDQQKVVHESLLIKKGGYAFVDLNTVEDAKEAIDKLNGKIDSKVIHFLGFQIPIFSIFFINFPPPPTPSLAAAFFASTQH